MAKLTYLNSVEKLKKDILEQSPEMEKFFSKLEQRITDYPDMGFPDSTLLADGKSVLCHKQSIEVYLFSGRIRYARSQLTLMYLHNEDVIVVLKINLSF
jgi:hypothetical protein